jgi:hypothetical protein
MTFFSRWASRLLLPGLLDGREKKNNTGTLF